MIFHKEKDLSIRNNDCNFNTIKINNNIINRVYKFKYLGIWLDPSLNFNKHYTSVLNNISNIKLTMH